MTIYDTGHMCYVMFNQYVWITKAFDMPILTACVVFPDPVLTGTFEQFTTSVFSGKKHLVRVLFFKGIKKNDEDTNVLISDGLKSDHAHSSCT